MNSNAETTDVLSPPESVVEARPSLGRLTQTGRKALIELLAKGSVLQRAKPDLYSSLQAEHPIVESVLTDMELRMALDTGAGMAILLRPDGADDDDAESGPALVRRRRLSMFDTFVILILRRYYRDREIAGDTRVFIEITQIDDALTPFMPLANSTSRERRALSGSLERMRDHGVLLTVRGDESRFEISPVIKVIVNLDTLNMLLRQYQELAGAARPESAGDDREGDCEHD